ncbi:MAG TPA: hypothetical protein VM070_01095, partial [Candidatus Saccharimonadales bacterium]|nr:hypothetical protein [Candidatus Saccharimonadales bacterium]
MSSETGDQPKRRHALVIASVTGLILVYALSFGPIASLGCFLYDHHCLTAYGILDRVTSVLYYPHYRLA